MKERKSKTQRRFFSYVEMMVVVMMMATLFTFLLYNMSKGVGKTEEVRLQSDLKTVIGVINYAAGEGLISKESEQGQAGWWKDPVIASKIMEKEDVESLAKRLEKYTVSFTDEGAKIEKV